MTTKAINFEVKQHMVELAGTCFWFWNSFHSFLESSGVKRAHYMRYGTEDSKYQVMRSILEDLEQKGDVETIRQLTSNFFRLKNPVDDKENDVKRAKKLLIEFKELVGNDPIEKEIAERERMKKVEESRGRIKSAQEHTGQLEQLFKRFCELAALKGVTPQKRGLELEKLVSDLLHLSEIQYTPSFVNEKREQIDGHFRYDGFDYLVECKWTDGLLKRSEVSEFGDKITGKLQSTRGFVISASGFDEMAVAKYSGDEPRIIFMDGEELTHVLQGRISFADAVATKVNAAVKHGNIYHHLMR